MSDLIHKMFERFCWVASYRSTLVFLPSPGSGVLFTTQPSLDSKVDIEPRHGHEWWVSRRILCNIYIYIELPVLIFYRIAPKLVFDGSSWYSSPSPFNIGWFFESLLMYLYIPAFIYLTGWRKQITKPAVKKCSGFCPIVFNEKILWIHGWLFSHMNHAWSVIMDLQKKKTRHWMEEAHGSRWFKISPVPRCTRILLGGCSQVGCPCGARWIRFIKMNRLQIYPLWTRVFGNPQSTWN